MKINIKSKKGFTLIELLVVIGILAVLAAIAIPSVAGLIDRANVSADKTNSNEMTNAIERFASEYELYCQDIASGIITPSTTDLDSAQNRVYNVVQTKTRDGIASLEVDADTIVTDPQIAIYRDTKYPANTTTLKAIVENYTKTSSATFDPKQSDMHYWYSPACGTVVVSTPESSIAEKNALIVSGTDAKGRQLDDVNELWIDLTINTALVGKDITNSEIIPLGGTYITASGTTLVAGEEFPSISNGDIYRYGNYEYRYNQYYGSGNWINNTSQGWGVLCLKNVAYPGEVLGTINGKISLISHLYLATVTN